MKEKINIGEIIKIGVILFVITAVSAVLLAFVNGKTSPLIEKNALEKEQTALKAVMPDAVGFEEYDIPDILKDHAHLLPDAEKSDVILSLENGEITKVYMALDSDNSIIGICVITETTGYDVGIQTVTGVDADLKVTGIEIISMNETPGLADEGFRNQYTGKSGEIGVSKSAPSDTEIQAISGATKTSNGVTQGVNIAIKAAEMLLKGGNE